MFNVQRAMLIRQLFSCGSQCVFLYLPHSLYVFVDTGVEHDLDKVLK